ncbi:MAG TPA: glycosyltransferase family 2 protein [Bacteroidetes bacterium]|nr:glycosyltransferase family 2 protein [Bacteroidota bacterium]
MKRSSKVIIVFPAYFAEKTLSKTIAAIPKECVDAMILVDDGSTDGTYELAQKLGLIVHRHERNRGYGGNQKTCYKLALEHGADIVIMVHPDFQYDPAMVRYLVEFIDRGYFDLMLGTRIRTRREALQGGMPRYKYFANRILTFIENIISGQNLSEWHTGMRAYRREVLETIAFERFSDDFVFDTQFLFAAVQQGYRIGEIPVPVRYFAEASMIDFRRSMQYGIASLAVAGGFLWQKMLGRVKYRDFPDREHENLRSGSAG